MKHLFAYCQDTFASTFTSTSLPLRLFGCSGHVDRACLPAKTASRIYLPNLNLKTKHLRSCQASLGKSSSWYGFCAAINALISRAVWRKWTFLGTDDWAAIDDVTHEFDILKGLKSHQSIRNMRVSLPRSDVSCAIQASGRASYVSYITYMLYLRLNHIYIYISYILAYSTLVWYKKQLSAYQKRLSVLCF